MQQGGLLTRQLVLVSTCMVVWLHGCMVTKQLNRAQVAQVVVEALSQ
jgi:hypothetical protein